MNNHADDDMPDRTEGLAAADVLCIGETMAAVVPADGGPIADASLFIIHPAGAESNVAQGLAHLGHRAQWASVIGDDPLGDRVLAAVEGAGVDISLVRRDPNAPTGVMFKSPGPASTAVHYYRRGSAASTMSPRTLDDWAHTEPATVHITGVTAALSADCAALTRAVVGDRRWAGASVSFDVNYRRGLWSVGDAAPALLDLARAADTVFVGLDEAMVLWHVATSADVRTLLSKPETVVVKDAAIGATAFVGDSQWFVPSLAVSVVERVGAGDAFAAGYLAGIARAADPIRCLRLAHISAAATLLSVTDQGITPSATTINHASSLSEQEWRTFDIAAALSGRGRRSSEGLGRESKH